MSYLDSGFVLGFELPFIVILLLLSVSMKVDLVRFSAIYTIFAIVKSLVSYVVTQDAQTSIYIGLSAIAMFVIVFIMSGVYGSRVSANNYQGVLSLGLFPWYLSYTVTALMVFITFLVFVVYSEHKTRKGFRAIGRRRMNKKARARLTEEQMTLLHEHGSVIAGKPFVVSVVITIVIYSFLML